MTYKVQKVLWEFPDRYQVAVHVISIRERPLVEEHQRSVSLRANPNENSIQLRKLTNQIVQNSRLN
jgi:hypothetical protein